MIGVYETMRQDTNSYLFFSNLSKKRIPLTVQIEITNKCNWHCGFCYLGNERFKELDLKTLKKLLEDLKKLGCIKIVFTGGEPLAYSSAKELFAFAKDLGFICEINTNGSLISNYDIDFLVRTFAVFNISLHAAIPATHDLLVGDYGAWKKTVKSIRALKEKGATVNINSVITKNSENEHEKLEKLVKVDLQCSWYPDTNIIPTYSGDNNNVTSFQINPDDYQTYVVFETKIDNSGSDKNVCTGVCKAGRNTCFVDVYGNVYPCISFKSLSKENKTKLKEIESIYDKPFRQIWNENKFFKIINEIKESDFVKCLACDSYNNCFKCIADNYLATGSFTYPTEEKCKKEQRKTNY